MYYQYFSSMRVAETERQRMANFVNFLVEVEKMEEQVSLPLVAHICVALICKCSRVPLFGSATNARVALLCSTWSWLTNS